MTIHLHAAPEEGAGIVAFPNTQTESMKAVVGQLENMRAALAERHGATAARLMLAEASVRAIAGAAREANSLIATRFALDVEIAHAFDMPLTGGDAA